MMKSFKKSSGHRSGIIGLVMGVLVSVLAAGCSQKTPEVKITEVKQLGVIELTADKAAQLDLGERRECALTPTGITNGAFQLNVMFTTRSFSGVIDPELTQTKRLNAHAGEKCVVTSSNLQVEFTPVLKD